MDDMQSVNPGESTKESNYGTLVKDEGAGLNFGITVTETPTELWFPAVGAQQNGGVFASVVQVVDSQFRPIEQRLDVTQGGLVELLVDLGCQQYPLTWICSADVSNDVSDWRRRASQIEPSDFVEGCAPRRGYEKNKHMIRSQAAVR
jgi:hypothetical protein